MAKITSNTEYDAKSTEYLGILRDHYTASKFYNDRFVPVNGVKYEDTLLLQLNDGASNYIADFKGTNILYSTDFNGAPLISGGIFTFFQMVSDVGGTFTEDLIIEDFSYPAKAFYAAALSTATADDREVVSTILAGDDTFFLSDFYDFAIGYAGSDTFYCKKGDDFIFGFSGKDLINGGDGIDTSFYQGKFNEYKFYELTALVVADSQFERDGIDTLVGIEVLDFFDLRKL